MSLDLLLLAIVRETATLIAAAATHQGARTSLAHLNDRLFHGLAQELHALGVRRRVSADMLGMVPRAYLRKVRRVEESATDRGQCLWEAVYGYVAAQGSVQHAALLDRFHRDDQDVLRGVIGDLRDAGVLLSEGRGSAAIYRVATTPELVARLRDSPERTEDLVWTFIHHEGPITRADLQRHGVRWAELDAALTTLQARGRIREEVVDGLAKFKAITYTIPIGAGLEGPLLNHFHAVVKALGTILKYPDEPAAASTYTLDVEPGHPMAEEALELFREWRRRASELRQRIDMYNATAGVTPTRPLILYLGLCKDVESSSRPPPGRDED